MPGQRQSAAVTFSACAALALLFAACGSKDDAAALRAEVVALQTQVAQPTPAPIEPTATPAPRPTVTATPTSNAPVEEAFAGIQDAIGLAKGLASYAFPVTVPGLSQEIRDDAWKHLSDRCDSVGVITGTVPHGDPLGSFGMNGRHWVGDLWPPAYARVGKAVINLCLQVQAYNAGRDTWASVAQFFPGRYREMKSAIDALPDESNAQLRRAIAALQ